MASDKFSFVADGRVRKILGRDYAELRGLDLRTATKSVIVLSGGVIEGLLLDALVAGGRLSFEQACQHTLKDMIRLAVSKGVIAEDRLTDAVRNYRNLIHPGREIRDVVVFDEADASLARSAVEVVIREVQRWAEAEAKRRKLSGYLARVSPEEREFLMLFASPNPAPPDQFEHPFLEHAVYMATRSLAENGILLKVTDEQLDRSQEKFRLAPDAIGLVEEQILKGKIQRESITLDYKNIAGSGAGGSGAPVIQVRHRTG